MASDGSTSSASVAAKSKQERIRDNQRRSRARRQEYLADLERRLKECHLTCREAELQRAAFADLQVENARLRDLLKYAGVSPDVVEGFGRQNMPTQADHAALPAHRQIKPKFHPPVPAAQSNSAATIEGQVVNLDSRGPTTSTSLTLSTSAPNLPMNLAVVYGGQYPAHFGLATTADSMTFSSTADVSPTLLYHWMPQPDSKPTLEISFCCDAFLVPPNGPLLADNGSTTKCAIAKLMIDHYNPTPEEMDEIKARLAAGFSMPRESEPGCRVDTQLLFQILREMNSREPSD